MTSKRIRVGILVAGLSLLMIGMVPAVFAAGFIDCLSPSSCSSISTINLSGPGSTATATFWLHKVPSNPGTVYYYVCPTSAGSCSSTSGTDNGWSWSFVPTSGALAQGSPCEASAWCEGNSLGSPDTLTLTITAPSVVTSSNQQENLAIYACSGTGSVPTCDSIYATVATGSVVANVPQFELGMGIAVAFGLVGLVVLRRVSSKSTERASLGLSF